MRVIRLGILILMSGILSAMSLRSVSESQSRMIRVLHILESHRSGKALIEKAKTIWGVHSLEELSGYLKWGSASRTDSTLVRNYNIETGEEKRERKVEVILREDQSDQDIALDLAHELVHALTRPAFDPYDPGLTPGAYISISIEGEGGEVSAMMSECQLTLEMNQSLVSPHFHRCKKYIDLKHRHVNRSQVLQDFYHSGRWYQDLKKQLGNEVALFPYLSDSEPKFYSSIEGLPYPHALLQEYQQLTQVACRNSIQRSEKGLQGGGLRSYQNNDFIEARCKSIPIEL